MISETKRDDSFPHSHVFLEGFSTRYRLDRDRNGGEILSNVRRDIRSNLNATENKSKFFL